MKTYMAKAETVERKWYVVDAAGLTLGRLASKVASVLRGKNKPNYTPNVDTGDFVFHVGTQEVREFHHVFLRAVFLGERINGKDVAATFRHVNTQVPDFLRELSFRSLDGVLHVHLRDIRVGSGFEFESQVVGTGIGTF